VIAVRAISERRDGSTRRNKEELTAGRRNHLAIVTGTREIEYRWKMDPGCPPWWGSRGQRIEDTDDEADQDLNSHLR
jgi:hypothetical protein